MSWIGNLIKKHTCTMCYNTIDKKDINTVTLNTAEGKHKMTVCQPCANELDEVLAAIEEAKNEAPW